MSDTPFPEADGTEIAGPDPARMPRASGVRRSVVVSVIVLLSLLVAGFLSFGGRAARQVTRRAPAVQAEATPQPAAAQDPLRSVQSDYSRLLEKPAPAPVVPPLMPALVPPAAPAQPQAQGVAPPAHPTTHSSPHGVRREQGVLVVQGGKQRQTQAPMTPASTQEAAAQAQEGQEARRLTNKEGFQQRAAIRVPETMEDRLHAPAASQMVLAGDSIPAVLLPGIHSDLPGAITAQVSIDVRNSIDGRTVLIPQGSRLFGIYDAVVVHGQDRVLIAWQRLRLPNGDSLQLEAAPGTDVAGYAGLRDKVDTHFWGVLRAVLLSSILSIGSRSIAGNADGDLPTVGQQVANEFSRGVNQAGQRIVDRELSRQPTIKIRPGMRFNVLVHRDMVLRPWDSARGTYADE